MFYKISSCRACGGTELVPVLDLGSQPLANDFRNGSGECAGYAPIEVMFCRTCALAQLSVVVKPEILYADYPYVTSKSRTMIAHFYDFVNDIYKEMGTLKPRKELNWLEIGSNDGTFLAQLPCHENHCLGFEPAQNLADLANKRGIKTIDRPFDCPSAVELGATGYRADVIVARHVFAHIDDWKGFIRALEFVTHKDSLVVIEVPYVGDMFKMQSWDQIYHEHLSYVSVTAIMHLLKGTKFYLREIKHYTIHGGAIALMIRRVERSTYPDPVNWCAYPEHDLEGKWGYLQAEQETMCFNLRFCVQDLQRKGKKICGFGASAKATVWLNACGLTAKEIPYVCDSTPQKQGKIVPGTDIPVVPEDRLMEADYAICFSWNFFSEIRDKLKSFEDKGGKWILPVPSVRIVE